MLAKARSALSGLRDTRRAALSSQSNKFAVTPAAGKKFIERIFFLFLLFSNNLCLFCCCAFFGTLFFVCLLVLSETAAVLSSEISVLKACRHRCIVSYFGLVQVRNGIECCFVKVFLNVRMFYCFNSHLLIHYG